MTPYHGNVKEDTDNWTMWLLRNTIVLLWSKVTVTAIVKAMARAEIVGWHAAFRLNCVVVTKGSHSTKARAEDNCDVCGKR
jgi:hypothetical protein